MILNVRVCVFSSSIKWSLRQPVMASQKRVCCVSQADVECVRAQSEHVQVSQLQFVSVTATEYKLNLNSRTIGAFGACMDPPRRLGWD